MTNSQRMRRERGDDLLDHAVGEIFLLRVAAHVLERQHRDRRLVGERQRRRVRASAPFSPGGPRPPRPADRRDARAPTRKTWTGWAMFFSAWSPRSSTGKSSFAAGLGQHRVRDADAAGLGHGFEPRGDVDAVAMNVVAVDDDVAEIDPDAPIRCGLGRRVLGHRRLPLDRAAHRVDDAGELDEQSVAGGLDDAAVMPGDRRVDQPGAQRLEPRAACLPHPAPISRE